MCWDTEYPRPQFQRDSFFSLNGAWLLNGKSVRVPFPPQSRLSGFSGEPAEKLTYERHFTLPEGFAPPAHRIYLHFGAVDQIAEVFLNGRQVAQHEGGYLPFCSDITDALLPGENRLVVQATDALCIDFPYGKQRKKRGGMWYTPVSGVWQSVWIEAVPQHPIKSLRMTPDLTGVTLEVRADSTQCLLEIPGLITRQIPVNQPVRIDMPEPRLWSPDDPYLYRFTLSTEHDQIKSYFALRKVEIAQINGRPCVLLNKTPIFLNGVLDQGYFEDGIYLPEQPQEYERDILRMKEMGMNLLRKHIKIEPEAFYYACDRLGMLVMQDMVNSGPYHFLTDTALPTIGLTRRPDHTPLCRPSRRKAFFTRHALDTQAHLYNHPCLVAYTIFNEGWGQFDADRHYDLLKAADPSRLYDATSGWFAQKKSDVDSLHVYFRNKKLHPGKRPLFLSECGGYARAIAGHLFNPHGKYGYGTADSEQALTEKIELMWKEMVLPVIPHGLCGVIYTQLSDVEDEINGLYTYDRQVRKADSDRLRALAAQAKSLLPKEKL